MPPAISATKTACAPRPCAPAPVATGMVATVPGVTPLAERLAPETVAHTVACLLSLPNNASVAWMPLNTRLESTV